MFPVIWTKRTFSNVKGKLILTNKRLIFTSGNFQDIISAVRGANKDKAEIPVGSIQSVTKGFMATIDIMANAQKYTFKGMRDAGGWVQAINSAKMMSGTVSYGAPPQQAYAPPPPPQAVSAGNRFCSKCGAPVATREQ